MATRSAIGVMHGDKCKAVYCHWDGYLDHNGRILLEHYDSAKANNLVALGDISSLGSEIGEKHDFDVRFTKGAIGENWTKFYGRDRGEEGVDFKVFHNDQELFEGIDAQYFYVMKDGVWYVSEGAEWKVLSEAIAEEETIGYKDY
jgi:hypothetical protein